MVTIVLAPPLMGKTTFANKTRRSRGTPLCVDFDVMFISRMLGMCDYDALAERLYKALPLIGLKNDTWIMINDLRVYTTLVDNGLINVDECVTVMVGPYFGRDEFMARAARRFKARHDDMRTAERWWEDIWTRWAAFASDRRITRVLSYSITDYYNASYIEWE